MISNMPKGTVEAHESCSEGGAAWDLYFWRSLFDREIDDLVVLIEVIKKVTGTIEAYCKVCQDKQNQFQFKGDVQAIGRT